jgi:ABC-2 type transport system permease protein
MIVMIPLIQLTIFGYAINTDVRHLRAAVSDQSGTESSRDLVSRVGQSQVVEIVGSVRSPTELQAWMRQGRISVGIVIPPDYAQRLARAEDRPAQLLVDGSDPIVGGAAAQLSRLELVVGRGPSPVRPRAVQAFEVLLEYNPEKVSAISVVPALLGVILTMTMVLFTAVAIVRERERGTLEMLITTPVKSSELMVGKILPYVGVGLVQISLIHYLGVAIFGVPVRGSILNLYLAGLAFIGANLVVGLLISTFVQNQFQAMQLTFFFFLPSILLSGFMFPFDGMPGPARWIGNLLPLTHFNRLSRGILLRGAGLWELRGELLALAVFFVVVLSAATLRFRKRLD